MSRIYDNLISLLKANISYKIFLLGPPDSGKKTILFNLQHIFHSYDFKKPSSILRISSLE